MKDYYPIMILPRGFDEDGAMVVPVPYIPPSYGEEPYKCPHCGSAHDNLWNGVGAFTAVINGVMLLGHIQECGFCHQYAYSTHMGMPRHGKKLNYDIHILDVSWFIESEE